MQPGLYMGQDAVRKTATISLNRDNVFMITATLNQQTWKWDAKVWRDDGRLAVPVPEDVDLSTRNPNRCIGRATEWVLAALDAGELASSEG